VNTFVFQRAYESTPKLAPTSVVLLFDQQGNLIVRDNEPFELPRLSDIPSGLSLNSPFKVGTLSGEDCIVDDAPADLVQKYGWKIVGLRDLYVIADGHALAMAGYSWQIVYFRRNHTYCPRCGSLTMSRETDWGRPCSNCDYVLYPRTNPAVLACVTDHDRILLVHKPRMGGPIQHCGRICRPLRVSRRVRQPRGDGRDRSDNSKYRLCGQPAMAVSSPTHDGVQS
jgi:NADH pyrophosphatase NudC (nudix superfamily)